MALVSESALLGRGGAMTTAWHDHYADIIAEQWGTKTLAQIATELGIGSTTIYRHVQRLGIKPAVKRPSTLNHVTRRTVKRYPKRQWTMDEDEHLAKYYNRNYTIARIAKSLKRSYHSVVHRAHDLGLSYAPSKLMITADDVKAMLGIKQNSIHRRTSGDAKHPIPHAKVGRYIEFGYSEVMEWLEQGHILSFDRARISPDLHRLYDAWRDRIVTSMEVYTADTSLGEWLRRGDGNTPEYICVMPRNQRAYIKADIYAWAYSIGHVIAPYAAEPFRSIRTAWHTEWVMKGDVYELMPPSTFHYKIKPHIDTTSNHMAVRRKELCARLREIGMDTLAKQFYDVAIPWQELVRDYERTMKR
jgi:predicted DNA-binding transcriptional regulator AlpA